MGSLRVLTSSRISQTHHIAASILDSMNGQSPEPMALALGSNYDNADADDAERIMSDLSTDESAENLETDLQEAMGHLGRIGRLLSFHTLPESLGGVSVKGVGNIAMPLEREQAQQISAHAREAGQFDGEYLTELDLTEFTLDDAIWLNVIQSFLDQAASNLGVTTPLRATPSKMLLIKPGVTYSELLLRSDFTAIGSLVVFLPSRHEGGEIVATHRGTEKVLFAPSQTAQSFTTWHYNINPRRIQSGCLWLLIYNVNTDANVPKLDAAKLELPRRELLPLRHALRRWAAKDGGSPSQLAFYYPFRDRYEPYRVSRNNLVPEDHILVRHLESLSSELPFEIFLAFIKRREESYGTSLGHEADQSKKYIARILDLGGFQLTKDGHITNGVLSSLDTTSPPRAAVVIIRHDKIIPFFYGYDQYGRPNSDDGAGSLLGSYARACLKRDAIPSSGIVFKQLCNFMMAPAPEQMKGPWVKLAPIEHDLLNVLEALLVSGFYSWFSQYVQNAVDLPKSILFRFRNWLAIADDGEKERLEAIEKVLLDVILAYPQPAQQITAVKSVINIQQERTQDGIPRRRPNGIPRHVLHFARRALNACIEVCENKQLTVQDGQALAEFALYFDGPFEFLSLVKDKISLERQPAAILGLIHKVDHYGKSGYLPKEECLKFSRQVAKSLIAATAFAQWHGIPDGRFFASSRDFVTQDNMDNADHRDDDDFDDNNDLDHNEYDEHNEHDDQDEWDNYEEYVMEDEREHEMYDEYDDEEFDYVEFYRTYRYDDDDSSIRKLEKDRYESQYGKVKPAFPQPRMEEKGVHFRSFFCFLDQILNEEDQSDGILELLASKIVDAAPQIPQNEFDTLWVPFVKEFIPHVLRIYFTLGDNERLLTRLLSEILKAYVDTWVGQYPERPSFARPGVRCSCPDCKGLNVFLENRLLRAGRFKADSTRVQHLLDEMARAKVDFKSDMVEDTDSVTLVVTKTERYLKLARRQWGNRRYHASKQVAKFGETGLQLVFGAELMSFLSMAHLGGIGFNNLEIRTLLKMKTGLSEDIVEARSATMFFRGLPRHAR